MPVCSCRPPSPGIWACGNSLTITLTWAARQGWANTGDKLMTLVASAMAGGDCIRRRRCVAHRRGTVLHPGRHGQGAIHPGDLPAQLPVGPLYRQLDRVSRELPARAWAAGAGPGDGPLTIDLDSTICETYGLAKEGARHHGYTGKRGYQAAGHRRRHRRRADVPAALQGRANTARGAAHFLRETVRTGALRRGQSDDSRYGPTAGSTLIVVSACRKIGCPLLHHHPPCTRDLRNLMRGDTRGCLDSHSLLDGRRRRCGRRPPALPLQSEPDAAPVRLIVRRLKPTPGSQLALFAKYSYHGFITDRDGEMLELEADPRRHAESRECHPRPQARCGVEPSPLRAASPPTPPGSPGPGDGPQHRPLDSAHRSGRAGGAPPRPSGVRFFSLAGRISPARRAASSLHLPRAGLGKPSSIGPGPIARPATPCLTAAAATGRHPANRTSPRTRASPVCECLLLRPLPTISP